MVQGTGPAAQGIGPAVHFPAGRPPSESPGDFPDSGGGSPMVPDSALLPRILVVEGHLGNPSISDRDTLASLP